MGLQRPQPRGAVPALPVAAGGRRDVEAAEQGIPLPDWERMENKGRSERPGERDV